MRGFTAIETAYPATSAKVVTGGRRAYQVEFFEVVYADGGRSDRLATAAEAIAEARDLMHAGERVQVLDYQEYVVWSSGGGR